MDNLKEKKINFLISKAREYLYYKNFSSAKDYINKAYNSAFNFGKSTYYITEYRKKYIIRI